MRRMHFIIDQIKSVSIILLGFLLSLLVLYGCANQKSQLSASQYRYTFEDEIYRIRSISSKDKTQSYNELIGVNFMAADFDQDRIIDCILLGEVSLNEAQKIYEYGLDEVTIENKLQVQIPSVNGYRHESDDLQLEIRSFRPPNAQPFNQFKITDNRPIFRPEIIVIVDRNADGTLDEVLKGAVTLEKVQSQYAEAIGAGLQKGKLIKVNNTILVKEK
ncbi:MAG: hypothetical protein JSW07_21610 [bacterium]|nr:MAG: hypothetical protein JSW07_21610 [bacterium]